MQIFHSLFKWINTDNTMTAWPNSQCFITLFTSSEEVERLTCFSAMSSINMPVREKYGSAPHRLNNPHHITRSLPLHNSPPAHPLPHPVYFSLILTCLFFSHPCPHLYLFVYLSYIQYIPLLPVSLSLSVDTQTHDKCHKLIHENIAALSQGLITGLWD